MRRRRTALAVVASRARSFGVAAGGLRFPEWTPGSAPASVSSDFTLIQRIAVCDFWYLNEVILFRLLRNGTVEKHPDSGADRNLLSIYAEDAVGPSSLRSGS